uniref:Uncharacterized protein n=1 Tax=Anguilla anguilla TaxID=7936 RepID=A0A0E9RIL0_ANGAN
MASLDRVKVLVLGDSDT